MTLEIDVNGRLRVVSVERVAAARFRVVLDGRVHEVDAVRAGAYGLSLILDGESAMSRHVQVVPAGAAGELLVSLEARTAVASANGGRSTRGRGDGAGRVHGQQAIVAPMPGRVLRVLVSAGDEVTARQAVVVIEAMKMENELRAVRPGHVKEVMVAPGASVEAGRVLAIIA